MMAKYRKILPVLAAAALAGCAVGSRWAGQAGRPDLAASLLETGPDGLRQSVLLTSHPANDTRFDVSRRGQIAFVSLREEDNSDIWIRSVDPQQVAQPRRLTSHSAVDDSPAFSPDGRRVAFVTHSEDARGDIAIIATAGGAVDVLTLRDAAERDPCWSPDGRRIAYARTHTSRDESDVYEIDVELRVPRRLTAAGGRSPSYSPDGRYIAYSSRRGDPSGNIWILRVSDRSEQPLTAGPAIDAFPTWSDDGQWVYFSRFSEDTDGDGRVSTQDNASIWRARLAGWPPAQPSKQVQLTSGRFLDVYPRVRGGRLYYTTNAQGNLDLAVASSEGIAPKPESIRDARRLASLSLAALPSSPYTTILVLRRILADPPALTAGGAEQEREALLAWCLLEIAKQYTSMGLRGHAIEALEQLKAAYPQSTAEFYEAEIRLQAHQAGQARERATEALQRQGLEAAAARLGAIGGSTSLTPHIRALAWVTAGDVYAAAEEYGKAEERYGKLFHGDGRARLPEARTLTGQAALRKIKSSLKLSTSQYADRDQQKKLYWGLVRHYPHVRSVYLEAARSLLDLELEGREFDHERLRQIVAEQQDQPVLAAMAQNRLADLYYRQRRVGDAKHEYQKVIETKRFADEAEQVAAAKFALAQIHYEQQAYRQCLTIYSQLTEQERRGDVEIFLLARRAYIRSTLDKARREFQLNDVRSALKTYRELMVLDWTLVVPQDQRSPDREDSIETFTAFDWKLVEAHKGYIACRDRLDLIATSRGHKAAMIPEAIKFYQGQAAKARAKTQAILDREHSYSPDLLPAVRRGLANAEAVAMYCVGLARTYTDDRDAAEADILQATYIQPRVPFFHQTLGWLYDQRFKQDGRTEWLQKAISRYQRALSLTDREADPQPYADLLLNLGNAHRQLHTNWGRAFDYYRAREVLDPDGEWLLHLRSKCLYFRNYGNAAVRKPDPDYRKGIELFDKALAAFGELLATLRRQHEDALHGEKPDRKAAARYQKDIRKFTGYVAEMWASKGLSHQMTGEHKEAADAFRKSHGLYARLGDQPAARLQLRNVAYNTLKLASAQAEPTEKLPMLDDALRTFGQALPPAKAGARKEGKR